MADEETEAAEAELDPATQVPVGPPRVRPRSEALPYVRDPTEVHGSDLVEGHGVSGDIGGRTLSNLLRIHPFSSFFCWLAYRQYAATDGPEAAVTRFRQESNWFFWLCVLLDWLVGIIAVAILIAAAAAVLYKTIWLTGSGSTPT